MERRGSPDDEEEPEQPAPPSRPAKRAAPQQIQRALPPEPVDARMPVSLGTISEPAALRLLASAIELASRLEQQADSFTMRKLAEAILTQTLSGGAARGVRLACLCAAAKTGRGHLDEHFTEPWRDLTALAVHAVYASAGRGVLYEELRSVPERVGRRQHGLGSDQRPGCARTRFLLMRSLSASDRHCPVAAIPLTTGTCWDTTSERGRRVLARPSWTSAPQTWPQSLAEHVNALLDDMERQRRLFLNTAIGDQTTAVLTVRERMSLRATFTKRFVMPPLPCGAPLEPRRDQAEIRYPGLDPELVTVFERRNVTAVLARGPHDPRKPPLPGDGFEPLRVSGTAVRITDLPDAHGLGITSTWGVEHFYDPDVQRVARRLTTPQGGSRTEIWQLVGFDDDLPTAVALIERQAQCSWMGECVKRFIGDCAPGKLKVHTPRTFAGMLALMIVANAAMVDADRRAQSGVEFA